MCVVCVKVRVIGWCKGVNGINVFSFVSMVLLSLWVLCRLLLCMIWCIIMLGLGYGFDNVLSRVVRCFCVFMLIGILVWECLSR